MSGDYLAYRVLATQRDTSGHCWLCPAPWEDVRHILTECEATREVRERILPELAVVLTEVKPRSVIDKLLSDKAMLAQFVVDCTSLNLPNEVRININNHELVTSVFSVTKDLCYSCHNVRLKKIKSFKETR